MALVLVLATLVLLSILVVGILLSARQEVSSSRSYGAGSDVKLLADVPLSLVTAQIAKATSDPNQAWISQPGLLRTFSSDGQQKAFKLYSSYKMEESSSYDPGSASTLSDEVPPDWSSRTNEFVDLNRPVQFGSRKVYPIADPNATSLVQGFSYDTSSVAPASASPTDNLLPMPVRWIYVTADGEFVGVDDAKRRGAVARVAFWTDDETCKVNLNTASSGVFFDTPGLNTREDHMMGRTQPIAQEYQRWPGHPATTSLEAVLKPLRDITDPVERSRVAASLTPRIGWGGSEGGTKYAWLTRELGSTDMERLYATVDELSYGKGLDASGLRLANTVNGNKLESSGQKLDELRFFLTTQSRAPELNLFNRPRISLWPFNQEMVATSVDPRLTPEDRLIRFASELGGVNSDGTLDYNKRKRFYFQRESAWDPEADWRDIPANRAVFRYLQSMTSRTLPSAKSVRAGSGTFLSKYGQTNRDSILTGMWDYLRSEVNTVNQAYVPVGFQPYSFPQGHDTETAGFDDIAPLLINTLGTKGMGRFPVLTEVIFQFINQGDDFEKDANGVPIDLRDNNNPSVLTPDGMPDYVIRKVRMVALLNYQMPVSSLYGSEPRFQMKINGATPFNFITDNAAITPVPNPLMNPGLPSPITMRNVAGGISTWTTDLAAAGGIGFPVPNSSGGFRDTNYVGSFFSGLGKDTKGGSMGPAYGMYAVIKNNAQSGNKSAETDHRFKVLANRTILGTDDQAWRDASPDSWAGRDDVYYPFVSDVIEFRLPQKGFPNPPPSPLPAPAAIAKEPVNANGKDYFETFMSGASLDITMYPGLKDASTALSPVNANWQTPSNSNCLMKTTINVANTIIPLPRPGPVQALSSTVPTTFRALTSYYVRGGLRYTDYLLNVPNKNASPKVTTQMDVFRSYLLQGSTPVNGDLRVAAQNINIPTSWWQPHPLFSTRGVFHATSLLSGYQNPATALDSAGGEKNTLLTVDGDSTSTSPFTAGERAGRLHSTITAYSGPGQATSPTSRASARNGSSSVGDFSQGYGNTPAGAIVVGPDLGGVSRDKNVANNIDTTPPYFGSQYSRAGTDDSATTTGDTQSKNLTGIMYSPFKQAPSPVIFGSLLSRPTGSTPGSWETLLFCPNPAGGKGNHRGWSETPRDHYLLDLFYMPVVEPYAITENYATAGKVNLNYQIAPFTYIKRKTALYALMDIMTSSSAPSLAPNFPGTSAAGSAIVAVPETAAKATGSPYRSNSNSTLDAPATSYRKFVDVDKTLTAFDTRFDTQNDPFVSASEICEMFLNPDGVSDAENFWNDKTLTGDDKREMPYNHLYPRVTTRSNTFRVHFWVQTLNSRLGRDNPIVTGEYRGSTIVERYLDPNIKDYGTSFGDGNAFDVDAAFPPLSSQYRFRQIEHQQFAP